MFSSAKIKTYQDSLVQCKNYEVYVPVVGQGLHAAAADLSKISISFDLMTGAPLSLWRIRVELTGRAKPQEDNVTIMTLGATESFVSSMEPVKNSHHTIVLIKPIILWSVCQYKTEHVVVP